jgi:hypothetical protein
MSASNSKIRRDGWTPDRQLRFLDTLARTRSVTRAARAAGMSRESAYRLRGRKDGALFAAAWDRALESHTRRSPSVATRKRGPAMFRENPPKVTKWKKWKDPHFNAFERALRDFRKLPV